MQDKLPERRSNHSAFIADVGEGQFLYVHGGHDLKEGAMNSMWRVDLNGIHGLFKDPYHPVAWEPVQGKGQDLGRISHHSAIVFRDDADVIFYGGMKGEDSNPDIALFQTETATWSKVKLNGDALPRDDHSACKYLDDSFMVFGGFVNGTRVNELVKFHFESYWSMGKTHYNVNSETIKPINSDEEMPCPRNSHNIVE